MGGRPGERRREKISQAIRERDGAALEKRPGFILETLLERKPESEGTGDA